MTPEQRRHKEKNGIAIAFLILWLGGGIGLYALEKRDIRRVDDASRGACRRLNVVRSRANQFELEAYRVFVQVADQENKLMKAENDPKKRALHEQSASQFFEAAGRLRYQPLTDCDEAIERPLSYQPPPTRPFTRNDLK